MQSHQLKIASLPLPKMIWCINKESVELTSVYLSEGCGKTWLEINDTIPHTRIDMGYRGTKNVPFHRYLYESECCPYRPTSLENFHILRKGLAKNTFTICNDNQFTDYHCKGKIFSLTNNTHKGVLQRWIKKGKLPIVSFVPTVSLSQGRDTRDTWILKSLVQSKKYVYLQHNDVMPKGNWILRIRCSALTECLFLFSERP